MNFITPRNIILCVLKKNFAHSHIVKRQISKLCGENFTFFFQFEIQLISVHPRRGLNSAFLLLLQHDGKPKRYSRRDRRLEWSVGTINKVYSCQFKVGYDRNLFIFCKEPM